MPNSKAPSRRTFLSSTAVAAIAVGGGIPLLSACGGGSDGGSKKNGTTTGKQLKDLLPTYVASKVVTPDIPSKNGSAPGFIKAVPYDQLPSSVPKKLGKGGTISVMAPLWGTPPKADNPYYKAMDAASGVNITWQNQDGNVYGQKLGAVLASSDIADVVVVPGWEMAGKIPSAIISKFADLGPYLAGDKVKDYPNLAAIPTGAWQRSVFGGALLGLPMPATDIPGIGAFYRKDIFDAKGYQVPTSCDEFMALAKEITSVKNKVWGCDDMTWAAYKFFGVIDEKPFYWKLVDGKLVNRYETTEFLEALEWSRSLYAAGVVHPDAKAAQGDAGNRFTAGEVLMYNQDLSDWYGKTTAQAQSNPEFEMAAMDYFNHDGGDPTLYAGSPANIFSFINKKASEEQIREILAVANFTAAPYGTKEQRLKAYGLEGTHYSIKDGAPVKNANGNNQVFASYEYIASPSPFYAYPDYPEVVKGMTGWQQRQGAFVKKGLFYGMQITEPTKFASLNAQFEDLEKGIVRGRKKISDMQQAVSDWQKNGGDELRDWYQKLLDESGDSVA